MIQITKIKSCSVHGVELAYKKIDPEKGLSDEYTTKSKRSPVPEFIEVFNEVRRNLFVILAVDQNQSSCELEAVEFKRDTGADNTCYKVSFTGSSDNVGKNVFKFKTTPRQCYYKPFHEDQEGEYIGKGKELSEALTEPLNALLVHGHNYIQGLSAQSNLFDGSDKMDGSESGYNEEEY